MVGLPPGQRAPYSTSQVWGACMNGRAMLRPEPQKDKQPCVTSRGGTWSRAAWEGGSLGLCTPCGFALCTPVSLSVLQLRACEVHGDW